MTPALGTLLTRQSIGAKHLASPVPDDRQLFLMALAALRAPDHGELVPYRFAVVGPDCREHLAVLFGQSARSAGKDEAGVGMEMQRAREAPLTVAVIARIAHEDCRVPANEQWIAIGGAITNLLNAAHALGFAGKMVSGEKTKNPDVVRAFCGTGESLAGWIVIGTPQSGRSKKPPKLVHPFQVMRPWNPAA
jgi:nitroreductase